MGNTEIEEMARCMANCGNTCDECFEQIERLLGIKIKNRTDHCQAYCYAEKLFEQGYRKIPEGSLVVTNNNAEELANAIATSPQMQSVMGNLIKIWQKEAAEKIIHDLMNIKIKDMSWQENKQLVEFGNKIVDKLEELAEQFGAEIKE